MMDSSPSKSNTLPQLPPLTGTKRPAPTLLPAFEPFSSSPDFPRPSKRRARCSPVARANAYSKYPTPIPTSTTGILSSSPPQLHQRAGLHRAMSHSSERAPLASVPSVTVPENGEVLRMGRSSNSSDYQLSANRLISRVHVEARYIAASSPLEPSKIEIKCKGWNGIMVHCTNKTWQLGKEDNFTSMTEGAEIMLDVQDARVRVAWPQIRVRKNSSASESESGDDGNSSTRFASARCTQGQLAQTSPMRRNQRVRSSESPTPAGKRSSAVNLADLFSDGPEPGVIKVFEDSPDEDEGVAQGQSFQSTVPNDSFAEPEKPYNHLSSQDSDLSEPEDDQDPDEENDPIVHSFGPFGDNISARMASFTAGPSPALGRARRGSPTPVVRSSSESTNEADAAPVVNHAINQLAFSRLSSTPLSTIMNNLPADLRAYSPLLPENNGLTRPELRKMLNAAACIGEIHREGKDAAGKALESEYYYIPDQDTDEERRAAVDGLRKPSLRNCRKQHKQYYWKKPRTP